jgi:excisionase family DNA binding protein
MDERWYTVEQIATTLQVHEQTVRRWLRTHALAGRYFGGRTGWRIRQSDLDALSGARSTRAPSSWQQAA